MKRLGLLISTMVCVGICPFAPVAGADASMVIYPSDATFPEMLAAKEIRRYVYVRTGEALPIVQADAIDSQDFDGVVLGRKDRPAVRQFAVDGGLGDAIAGLQQQEYLIKTIQRNGRRCTLVAGGDEIAVLHGAYRLAEHLGVRFYLHGDVVPDDRVKLELPIIDERGKPLFELRGIQPFHDFPEGPDWWDLDDYKAIISQLPKLRMNFIGLHTYPECSVGPEPTVWIGLPEDMRDDGEASFSYPSRHFTTLNGRWGYLPKKTSDYACGAAAMFERDAYGARVMIGRSPWPATPRECNQLFDRFGHLLGEAFTHARALGVKTCVGTEIPLITPKSVMERIKAAGRDPADAGVIRDLYRGVFRRISRTYPLDYYWFWTRESWTWRGVTEEKVEQTLQHFRLAIEAADQVKAPFTLATCGWVLGPQQDRALFDNELPKSMPMSCINRQVGRSPVEPGFARIAGRPQWAIPWLEDDSNMICLQLWVGRMRRDAFDALRYGCTGLMGIHWRTRILGPNVSALANAAWDQRGWSDEAAKQTKTPCLEGAVGGKKAAYPKNAIADTEDDPLYQTVRYDVSAYRVAVPDGTYTVTLKFCEPHYAAAGQRAFGVEIQGQRVLHKLDVFETVGRNKAYDLTFKDIQVAGGPLIIDFMQRIEFPCIAAIVVEGSAATRKINCGGPAYKDYETDLPLCPTLPRHLPAEDFYLDWATVHFGREVGPEAAAIFVKLDGHFPEPSTWVGGPGGIRPDERPWAQAAKAYAFVDEFAALRPRIKGAGYLERFDYWLENFRYMKAVDRVKCTWARYNAAMKKVDDEKDAEAKGALADNTALPLRKELVRDLVEVYRHLLATVSSSGEMGTVANWEQHILPSLLDEPGQKLVEILGEPLPADALLRDEYSGPPRIIVPTVRTSLTAGEPLRVKVIVLAARPPLRLAFLWRPMGQPQFSMTRLRHIARGVYQAELEPEAFGRADFEYYVEASISGEETLRFPSTAPTLNQTVIVVPEVK